MYFPSPVFILCLTLSPKPASCNQCKSWMYIRAGFQLALYPKLVFLSDPLSPPLHFPAKFDFTSFRASLPPFCMACFAAIHGFPGLLLMKLTRCWICSSHLMKSSTYLTVLHQIPLIFPHSAAVTNQNWCSKRLRYSECVYSWESHMQRLNHRSLKMSSPIPSHRLVSLFLWQLRPQTQLAKDA
jgi:hypothetical protein